MLKYLIKSAADVLKDEGIKGVVRETLKYVHLYGSPAKLLKYRLARMAIGDSRVIRNVQGSLMGLNLAGNGIHADLFMYGKREPEATDVMQRIIKPEWTCCDIGANIGYYALMEAKRCAKVYAIEPGPDNIDNLKRNILLNGYKNIEVFHTAVGDKDGTIPFALNSSPNWHRVAVGGEKDVINVPVVTLDNWWASQGWPKIDLLRMDVEGYEQNILLSGRALIEACHPAMFIEVHRDHLKAYGHSALELLKFLGGYDYSVTHSFILARPGPVGEIKQLVFYHPDRVKLLTDKGMASHLFFQVQRATS